ncbi:unnamed protein product [Lactuca saligna]|uniref:Uncharacterized protein n=1 Tax=Lactuca saligna TaxID=75948 RepID=A0AA35VCP6_LACSI|nr:unnamed protein product [Lactuca saligna]
MTSLLFPFHSDHHSGQHIQTSGSVQPAIMRLILRDAILRLCNNDFSILSLAIKQRQVPHCAKPFHVNRGSGEASRGAALLTLERGKPLLITTSGAGRGLTSTPMRINYVRIKVMDIIRNVKLMVHSVYLPFPHINLVAAAYDSQSNGGYRRSPWPVINPESVALVTRLRLFVVFLWTVKDRRKGPRKGNPFEYQSGPCAGLAWKAT